MKTTVQMEEMKMDVQPQQPGNQHIIIRIIIQRQVHHPVTVPPVKHHVVMEVNVFQLRGFVIIMMIVLTEVMKRIVINHPHRVAHHQPVSLVEQLVLC